MASKTKFDPTSARKRWMLYALSGAAVSWLGLWGMIQLPVNEGTEAVFFILLFTAMMTTFMPALAYLNARFGQFRNERTYRARFVRQSIWIGLFIVISAWLRTRRVLDLTLALILLAVFVLTETFLVTREGPLDDT